MKYDFNEVHNRLGTYCTQWDYIQDRFNKKDLIPFSISDTDFIIPKPITEKIFEVAHHQIYGYKDGIIMILNHLLQDILKEDIIHILKKIGFYIVQQSCIQFLY